MEQLSEELKKWIQSVDDYTPASWERLPELELYMDQVVTFLNRQLEPFTTGDERLLTPSMVNNYVKDGVLPRPEKKKYSRNHLAMLMMICSLKSVLSLPEISEMLQGITEDRKIEEQYPGFIQAHSEAMNTMTECLDKAPDLDKEGLYKMALQLALEANARRIAAARILDSLDKVEKEEKELEKEKTKEKENK